MQAKKRSRPPLPRKGRATKRHFSPRTNWGLRKVRHASRLQEEACSTVALVQGSFTEVLGMSWLETGALPIGMLMFGIMTWGFLRRKAGHVVARNQYPALAEELGLSYRASRYASGVGRMSGIYEGYQVVVDPDDQRHIRVVLPDSPGVELWMHAHNRRPPPGMQSFQPENRQLSALFRTAHGTPSGIEAVQRAEELETTARRLRGMRELKSLSVTESGITAVLDYGNPPFIPASVVRTMLRDLVQIASNLQR